MAVESNHIINWSPGDIKGGEEGSQEIPSDRVISFNFDSFKPERVKFIKVRMETLCSKILLCPSMRPAYIQEINKLILYEIGEKKNEI